MHRDSRQGRRCRRQGGGQGFALPGFHLRQPALQHHPAAHDLGIVVAFADGPVGYFPNQGKGLPTKGVL
jgi:hypothetical protein